MTMITLTPHDFTTNHCVYEVYDNQQQLVFMWSDKLANVYSLKDLVSNPEVKRDEPFTLFITKLFPSEREARNHVTSHLNNPATKWPKYNKTVRYLRYTPVQCIETGVIYKNALYCARSNNINQSQLSQHLRGVPGYKTVKGHTYRNYIGDGSTPVRYQV